MKEIAHQTWMSATPTSVAASVWHVRHAKNFDGSAVQHRDSSGEVLIDDDFDDVKIVGIYSSEQAAAAAISRAQMRPRFAEEPDCFTIDSCTVDEDSWTDGFVTIPVRSDLRSHGRDRATRI